MAALILASVGALAGEWFLRYREHHRATVPGAMPMLYYQHRRLQHAYVRDFQYYGWVTINRAGFRGRPVTPPRDPATTRIMAVGSSTTFDAFVTADSLSWPAQLERRLKLRTGRSIEIINAGVSGYTVLDNLIRLQTELVDFDPDVIVLYEGHNDLFKAITSSLRPPRPFSPRPDEVPTLTPWRRWLTSNSMLYGKLVARWRAIRFHSGDTKRPVEHNLPGQEPTVRLQVAAGERYRRHLRSFVLVAHSMGIRVVMPELIHISEPAAQDEYDPAVRARWNRAVPVAYPQVVLGWYREYNQIIRDVAEATGAVYLPTCGFGLRGPKYYADGDPIHFNDWGAGVMADSMASALVDSGVVGGIPAARTAGPRTCPGQEAPIALPVSTALDARRR